MSTEEEQATAIIAALNAAEANPFDYDDIDRDNPPEQYTEVTVSRRYGGTDRNDSTTGRVGWRITTRAVATTVSNAREMRNRTVAALLYKRVTVGGELTTPIQFESEDPIAPDDGMFSGLCTWTYVT